MKKLLAVNALVFFFNTTIAQNDCSIIKVTAFSRFNTPVAKNEADTIGLQPAAGINTKERFIYIVASGNAEPVIKLIYGKIKANCTVQEEAGRTIIAGRDATGRKIVIGAPIGFSIWRVDITGPDQLMNGDSAVTIMMRGSVAKKGFSYRNIPETELFGRHVY